MRRWLTSRESALSSVRREGIEEGAPPSLAAQARQLQAAQSGPLAGAEICEGAPAAGRFPPQDRAGAPAHLRHRYYEQLSIAHMARHPMRSKAINDAAWGRFCVTLACKAEWAGKRAIAVAPELTSQRCSNTTCGRIVPKGLSVRWHRCPHCGTELDRDQNAARNILRLGQATAQQRLGQSLRGVGVKIPAANREAACAACQESVALSGVAKGRSKNQSGEFGSTELDPSVLRWWWMVREARELGNWWG